MLKSRMQIHPIVRKYLLTVKDTTEALIACGVPRAANVAQIKAEYAAIEKCFSEATQITSSQRPCPAGCGQISRMITAQWNVVIQPRVLASLTPEQPERTPGSPI
jgi:hypothetical protein